jgi:hypothetical protein
MYRQIMILTALICSLAAPALAAQMSVEPLRGRKLFRVSTSR